MKKLLITLLALVVAIGAAVVLVFWMTGGVTRAGDRFLSLVRQGRTHDAYLATSKAFRTATPEEGFVAYLRSTGLADNESARWSSRSLSGDTGELEGSIRTRSGGTVPLKLKLVKEESEWRVLAVERVAAGVLADAAPPATPAPVVPPEAELSKLARSAVLQLGKAIAAKDFTEFHASTAALWQRQTTPDALKGAFRELIDKGADLSVCEGRAPEFTEKPSIDGNGRLVLVGVFPTQPTRVGFTLKYLQEAGAWKLAGINLDLEPAPLAAARGVVPPEDQLRALTHGAMTQFATAVARDDFSKLHAGISSVWRRQISEAELKSTFQVFVDKKIPLTVVETGAPVFTEPASFDSDGLLNVAGHYPTRPMRVDFRLRFLEEDSQWRLAGIEVNTKEE